MNYNYKSFDVNCERIFSQEEIQNQYMFGCFIIGASTMAHRIYKEIKSMCSMCDDVKLYDITLGKNTLYSAFEYKFQKEREKMGLTEEEVERFAVWLWEHGK